MSTPKDSWSSSSSTPTWKYDVFLSFRGKDTRNGFVSHLYAALKQKSISTFKDDVRLERGNHISSDLLEAIEKSRFAIVIFSRNYAFSKWCLDELVKIVECKKNLRTTILPVFYYVDPSDVRNQRKTFARAFVEHKSKNLNKEQMWKDALKEVANISGWHLQNRSEAEIIQKIVEMILHKLNNTFSIDTKGLIGIDSQVDKLTRLLAIGLDDVRFIGIRGMGGMGKSTLARVVYSIFSNKFEACSFIGNIREVSEKCGLLQLQQSLLYELLMERCMNIQDVDNGVLVIKNRLRHKRILLVLDDVTEIDQLNKLAGEHNWFGRGSRVVITTRDEHLLLTHKVDKIYEPIELNYNEALQLFSLKVFGKHHPAMGYLTLSKSFVQYANGVPLAIEILGSFLSNRSMEIWKNALDRLKDYPERKVIDVLQISFDGLEQTEKDIFLHIACFFNQYDKDLVEEILGCLDLYPKIGLARLIDNSLVKLHGNKLWMHDLLQQMGRDIVRRECHKEPWKRSRMWLYKDIDNVLAKNTVIDEVEGIVLNWPEPEESHWNSKGTVLEVPKPKEAHWNCEAFSKMPNLKLLVIRNVYLLHKPKHLSNGLKFLDWSGYPSKYLPSNLLPDELVGLRMCYNNIEQFWTGTKCFDKLKFIQLNESRSLIETPDFTRVPNLEKLVMEDCLKLHTVHPSMGVHRNLTVVNFKGCKSIRNLPNKFEMESLEILILSSCSKVQKLPKFMGNMERVSQLYLDGTAITKLLTSIGLLSSLVLLNTRDCKRLVCLPSTIFNLKLLKDVNLSGCSKLERLPENLGNAKSIVELNLSGTAIRQVPSSIRLLKNLKVPCFHGREGFSSSKPWYAPSLLGLYLLTQLDLSYCNLTAIPVGIGCLFSLECLNLSGNGSVSLPKSINQLPKLSIMHLDNCNNRRSYVIIPLVSVILKWFMHQSMGDEVNIKVPSSHLCDEWMGVAGCVVLRYLHQINYYYSLLTGQLIANERVVSKIADTKATFGLTDHSWLFYLLSPYYEEEKGITLLKECETYEFSQVGIKIEIDSSKIEVKKCGFPMLYKKDRENLNRTMAQSSNTIIIPWEDLAVLYHNFVNSAVVAEGNKANQTSDNYDGVGPSGEGSSNNIPNPKLIERLPEFTAHGDSDCEEYWECSEELSGWHESGDSELEG